MQRPTLNKNIKIEDFKDFYWLKEELIIFCREQEIITSGGNIEITKRIEKFLLTGIKITKSEKIKTRPNSQFDWNNEKITKQTKITDNYKNSENVREFFLENIGTSFKFNVKFMNWMKSNVGLNMTDAISEWNKIDFERKNNKNEKEIEPQFEYNRYIRDFMKDNPSSDRNTAIKCWKNKKSLRGHNNYEKSDLMISAEK